MLAVAGLILVLGGLDRADHPQLPSPWWGLLPLALAVGAARTAVRCSRHAYLILTPLGLEIFPFFRPAAGMQLVPWAQIAAAEIDDPPTRLTLHFDAAKSAGIHLSLEPIHKPRRPLLARAITSLMQQRGQATLSGAGEPART
jgi:hypothetical protein